ncbi:hypothetical protein QTN25_010076 [Entamoeba marina]
MNNKQIDSYSMLICSKYFETSQDFINLICVNSKFKETTEKLRFNPIPIKSLKLFPKIQTQYLYDEDDKKIERINNYEIWYKIDYDQYLKFKDNNTKYHYIVYTNANRLTYGNNLPDNVTELGNQCFIYCKSITSIDLPLTITKLNNECFWNCSSLQSINLPPTLKIFGDHCCSHCYSLKSINLPPNLPSLGKGCFSFCSSLTSINLPSSLIELDDECFFRCESLISINLPSAPTSLGNSCFYFCSKLTSIDTPSSITSFGEGCFHGCDQLKSIINVPDQCYVESFIWKYNLVY